MRVIREGQLPEFVYRSECSNCRCPTEGCVQTITLGHRAVVEKRLREESVGSRYKIAQSPTKGPNTKGVP
jgi:hypothetical protein